MADLVMVLSLVTGGVFAVLILAVRDRRNRRRFDEAWSAFFAAHPEHDYLGRTGKDPKRPPRLSAEEHERRNTTNRWWLEETDGA